MFLDIAEGSTSTGETERESEQGGGTATKFCDEKLL